MKPFSCEGRSPRTRSGRTLVEPKEKWRPDAIALMMLITILQRPRAMRPSETCSGVSTPM